MKKKLAGLALVATMALASSPAFATFGKPTKDCSKLPWAWTKECKVTPVKPVKPVPVKPVKPGKPEKPETPPVHAVPEINAATAGLALALLGGIVAIRRERRNGK